MANQSALLKSISQAAGKTKPVAPAAPPDAATYYKAPSREGRINISAWLDADFKVSLRSLQVKFPNKSLQSLFEEALNDLFAKYDVPVVGEPQRPSVKRAVRAPKKTR